MTRGHARAVGDVVAGRFELRERLGAGGMGTVWRAHDPALERDVALKEMRSGGHDDPARTALLRERAMREARALARINHPGAVAIYEVVDDRPHPWLVMEFVDGTPLDTLLRGGALTPVRTARIGLDVLAALRAAHSAGILHRDVKPANVLVRPDGSAVLTDFGIAALQGSHTLTATGDIIGSPEYLAPELIRRTEAEAGPASDLWSLGVLLYACVEGTNPMRRDSVWEVLVAVCEEPVPPPPHAGPLAPVITALLTRDPGGRPDIDDTARALAAVRDEQPSPVGGDEPTRRLPPLAPGTGPTAATSAAPTGARTRRRLPRAAAAVLGVAALAATGVGVYAALPGSPSAGPGPGVATPSPTASPTPTPTAPGLWIAQLSAVPHGSDRTALDQELLTLQRKLPGARLLNSNDWKSLNPGYWVIYTTGDFPDGDSALAFCTAHGRSKCVGRYLSQDPADGRFICVPPPTPGQPSSREACRRP
ncbi:serine/threonine-protein kinase [Kitasatospora misakiensis]|uniref:non-specific serine/threonine protein kinase n=1 Tax=Kitasatospora misakiensis TaxID=67330 RepID=A0ABW0XBZ3_9ACTN